MRNLEFEKVTSEVRSYFNSDYPISVHIIKSGYAGRYLVVDEDVIECKLQMLSIPEIWHRGRFRMSFYRDLISHMSGLDKISDSVILCELRNKSDVPDVSKMTSEELQQATQDAIEHLNQITDGNK